MDSICQIEVVKDGREFAARAYFSDGPIKEYRNPILEQTLTEMVIDLQELLEE